MNNLSVWGNMSNWKYFERIKNQSLDEWSRCAISKKENPYGAEALCFQYEFA